MRWASYSRIAIVETFCEYLDEMLSEPAERDLRDAQDPDIELWNRMKTTNAFTRKDCKVVLGRFSGVVRRMKEALQCWGQTKLVMLNVTQPPRPPSTAPTR